MFGQLETDLALIALLIIAFLIPAPVLGLLLLIVATLMMLLFIYFQGRFFISVPNRLIADITREELATPPALEGYMESLKKMGFQRLGEFRWQNGQTLFVLADEEQTILAELTEASSPMLEFASFFSTGTAVETAWVSRLPAPYNLTGSFIRLQTVGGTIEEVYLNHRRTLEQMIPNFGALVKFANPLSFIDQRAQWYRIHGQSSLLPLFLWNAVVPGLWLLNLVMLIFSNPDLFLSTSEQNRSFVLLLLDRVGANLALGILLVLFVCSTLLMLFRWLLHDLYIFQQRQRGLVH